mgnify:CR=1 FL=1
MNYYANTNRLKSVADGMGGTGDNRNMGDVANFVYDSEGNLTEDKSKRMTIAYDWRGMPVEFKRQDKCYDIHEQVVCDSIKLEIAYDGAGSRVSKTLLRKLDGTTGWNLEKKTHYTGIGSEIRVDGQNGTKVVVNMPQGLGRYAIESDNGTSNGDEFYLKNHLGSTMMVAKVTGSNAPAEVSAVYDYRAFGEQVNLTEPTDKVTENFTGKEKDDETELNYFGARYLDPMLGLWVSVDAARQYQNPYLYAGNNPVMRTDPDGNADVNAIINGAQEYMYNMFMSLFVKPQLETANKMLWDGTMTTLEYERKIGVNLAATFIPYGSIIGIANDMVEGYMDHGFAGVKTNLALDIAFMGIGSRLPDNIVSNILQTGASHIVSNVVDELLFGEGSLTGNRLESIMPNVTQDITDNTFVEIP